MACYLTKMTSKGQITIPADIRRALALKQGDKVAVTMEDGHARIDPYGSVVARTAGIFKGAGPTLTAEEERAAFEQAVADEVMETMERWK
jgi:AbrB family looped-hinge helix DNA binding protein